MQDKERKRMILERLLKIFESEKVPAVLRKMDEEEGLQMDVLATLHTEFGNKEDEVMGEFYFLPLPDGADGVCYFSSVITLTETIDPLCLGAVCQVVAMLNFYLEYGAFAVNTEGNVLAYKMVTPIFTDMEDEQLYRTVDMNMAHALGVAEDYAGILIRLAEGDSSLPDVMELLFKKS